MQTSWHRLRIRQIQLYTAVLSNSQLATAQCKHTPHCISRTSDFHTDLDHIMCSVQPHQLLRVFSSSPPAQLTPAVCRQLVTRICKLHLDLISLRHIHRSYDLVTAATCIHVDTNFKPNQAALHQSCGAVNIRHSSAPRVRTTPRHIRHFEYHGSGSQPTATRPDLTSNCSSQSAARAFSSSQYQQLASLQRFRLTAACHKFCQRLDQSIHSFDSSNEIPRHHL